MKRIPRNPFRFDVFGLFAEHAQQHKLEIHTPEATQGFLDRLRASVTDSLDNAAFLHGQRTETLFEALCVALGTIRLIKREDAGDIHSAEDVRIPDFRVVLSDGRNLLVEVKNVHQRDPINDVFEVSHDCDEALARYCQLVGCELRFAVFWSRWGIWTLVPPQVLKTDGGKPTLSFPDAMLHNEMALLGDKSIGTVFPLRLRFVVDRTKPRTIGPNGEVKCTFADIKILARDAEITDRVEKNIAWYLITYGSWQSEGAEAITTEGELDAVEERFMPPVDEGQGFEIVGSLSGMYSAFYRQSTSTDGRIGQVRVDVTAGHLGRLIPDTYESKALPLWIFILSPAKPITP